MIKMFASDLDGTLLNALHEADGTIRRAIRELTEAGKSDRSHVVL